MAELTSLVGYREVPSSAIEYLELDFDHNYVKITYKFTDKYSFILLI